MITAPFWGSPVVPGQVRVFVMVLVGALLLPVVRGPLPPGLGSSVFSFVVPVAMELLLGFLFAYAALFIFSAAQFAGQLVDIQMGFGVANVIDPLSSSQVTLIGQVQYLVALLVFLLLDGHHMVLDGLVRTFSIAPLGAPLANADSLMVLVESAGKLLFVVAAQLAAPVMTVLFMTNLALGLVSRMLPQMNIFLVGLPLQVGVGLLALAVSLSIFTGVWRGTITELKYSLDAIVAAVR